MPLTPYQFFVASLQLMLLLVGAWGLARILGVPATRARVFERSRLVPWSITGPEVALLLVTFMLFGIVGQGVLVSLFREALDSSPEKTGLQVAVYGFGLHGFPVLAWPLFHVVRRALHSDYGVEPPVAIVSTPRRLSWAKVLAHAVVTLLLILPVLTLASALWTLLLRQTGLPDAPQELIEIFGAVQSPWVFTAMLLVACVVAPLNEELIFRRVIFRFCRQRFGRGFALLVSGVLFGALHGNWAGFFPLALLGVGLAIAYERTGDLRVPILAHGLFNLNTILIVLSGLAEA